MKILQLTKKFPYPLRDGGAIAKFNMIKGFAEAGHDVTVLALNTKKHFTDIDNLPEEIKKLASFYAINVDTTVTLKGGLKNWFFSNQPYIADRFMVSEYRDKLVEILQENTFDVIQLEGLYLCPYIETIRIHSKALVVLRAHNVEHEIWRRTAMNEPNILKKIYLRSLTRRLAKFEFRYINDYDLLVPISETDNEKFKEMGNRMPSLVSQTGITSDFQKPIKTVKNRFTIFHIGGLDWSPNQEGLKWYLTQVWPNLKKKYNQFEFLVAGRNAPEWLIELIKKQNAKYVGEVPDAVEFMDENQIMIVPIFAGSGMRIKIIEGLARGKNIITTTVGVEGINCKDGVELLIADDAKSFEEKTISLIENPDLSELLSFNAREFVFKNFDNFTNCQKLADFYLQNKG